MKTKEEILSVYEIGTIGIPGRRDIISAMDEYAKEVARKAWEACSENIEISGGSTYTVAALGLTFDQWWEETFPQDKK